jgi:hypothetical protein
MYGRGSVNGGVDASSRYEGAGGPAQCGWSGGQARLRAGARAFGIGSGAFGRVAVFGVMAPDRLQTLSRPEAFDGAGMGAGGFDFAVARGGVCDKRLEQVMGSVGDVIDAALEGGFVGLRRPCEARKLAHELRRGGADLGVGGRRIKIIERFNIATHARSIQ